VPGLHGQEKGENALEITLRFSWASPTTMRGRAVQVKSLFWCQIWCARALDYNAMRVRRSKPRVGGAPLPARGQPEGKLSDTITKCRWGLTSGV